MNKSLLIQNGIAGGIAGTVADGLFNNEDEHHYAKSAFMGTLAGVGATALHQSLPSENKVVKATAEHKPPVPATPEAQAAPTPVPKPAPVAKAEAAPAPVAPEPVVPKAEPQPAPMKITPIEPKQAEPPKAVVPVKPSEEPKQEFIGPKDKPLSRKLTKTINSVKQTASGINNGIVDGARRLSATAAQLKIPPIQINVPQISQNIREKGRTVASGLARSAQALSIAAIASMDMGGGHAVVQHAFEAASHSVQVQASMATSTMTKAVNNITEAVGNYHPGQGIENTIKNMQAVPKAAESTVAIPKAVQSYQNDSFALPMFHNQMENSPLLQNKLQASIVASANEMLGKPFKPSLQYRCADSVSTALDSAIQNSHTKPLKYSHQLEAKQFGKMNFQEVPYKDMKPGDILGFTNTWRKSTGEKDFSHVGIYLGNGKFGHRSGRGLQNVDKSWGGGEFHTDDLSDWLTKRIVKNTQVKAYRVNGVVSN